MLQPEKNEMVMSIPCVSLKSDEGMRGKVNQRSTVFYVADQEKSSDAAKPLVRVYKMSMTGLPLGEWNDKI